MRLVLLFLVCLSLPAHATDSLRILLTNDDGYEAPGIRAIQSALLDAGHDVYMVAPATQQSGRSSAITGHGVRVTAYPGKVWAVHGTPSDAVRVGLGNVMWEEPPDLVVAGANLGQNAGRDVILSGTVGAALAAHNMGFPAIAISVGIRIEERSVGYPSTIAAFKGAGRSLVRLIDNLDLDDLTSVLNINYPPVLPLDVRGVRWTDLSSYSVFSRRYDKHADGLYRPQLQAPNPNAPRRDAESLMDGFITMTFLDGDMSVPVKRSQRYLDRYLLDRDYEPSTAVERREPVSAQPPRSTTPEPEPVVEPATADAPEDALPTARFEHRVPHESQVTTEPAEGHEAMERAEAEEIQEEQRQQEARKKKPDSWLRRIFDPASWRR